MQTSNLITRLVEYVQAQPDYNKAEPAFVSVYRHHRCFGGPEEGGWWYDRYQLEGSKPFNSIDEAQAWLDAAKGAIERQNREEAPARYRAMASLPDEDLEPLPAGYSEGYIPSGWDDGGELMIIVEDVRGHLDNMNEPTPHYE